MFPEGWSSLGDDVLGITENLPEYQIIISLTVPYNPGFRSF